MADDGEIDRTSATGLFNYARSYWRSGVALDALAVEGITHPRAPVTFLLCHAIELYLKAFLRARERDLATLKKIGHRVSDLAKAATVDGIALEVSDMELLSHMEREDVALDSRYIVTGFKHLPTNAALAEVAEHLDNRVGEALREAGFAVREQAFEPPTPASQLEPETLRVLTHLFLTNDRGDRTMASELRMELNMLQYHLDQLEQANLATAGGGNYVSGETSWLLTPEGRRYVVQHKLHRQ